MVALRNKIEVKDRHQNPKKVRPLREDDEIEPSEPENRDGSGSGKYGRGVGYRFSFWSMLSQNRAKVIHLQYPVVCCTLSRQIPLKRCR